MTSPPGGHGIAGIPLLAWPHGLDAIFPGDRVFFGCDIEISRRYGAPNPGSAKYLRARTHASEPAGAGIHDAGELTAETPTAALGEIALRAAEIGQRGAIPLLLACDHTASLCALIGVRHGTDELPVYVYFDAHFDLGRNCAPGDLMHNGGFVGRMLQENWVERAVNIGGRSLMAQADFPETPNFVSLSVVADTDLDTAFAFLRDKPLYVSIDADVLDPAHAPNVCCPESGGMSPDVLLACCRWLGRHCRVLAADLSELLPATVEPGCERHLIDCLIALTEP